MLTRSQDEVLTSCNVVDDDVTIAALKLSAHFLSWLPGLFLRFGVPIDAAKAAPGGPGDPELAASMDRGCRYVRPVIQGVLGVAVIGLAMINGGLINSYLHRDAHHMEPRPSSSNSVEPYPQQIAERLDAADNPPYLRVSPTRDWEYESDQAEDPTTGPAAKANFLGNHQRSSHQGSDEGCKEPECLWYTHHMETKIDTNVEPCDDFYSHVCSAKWFSRHLNPTFEMESLEKLMSSLNLNLRMGRHSVLRWIRNSASLYDACRSSNGSKAVRDKLLVRLRKPSTTKPPEVVFRMVLQEMMPQLQRLQSEYLEGVKMHPLANVYMAPSSGANGYVPCVDSPQILLKRFFLRHPERTEGDYRRLVENALTDVDDPVLVASKIVHIERRLCNIVSGTSPWTAEWILTPARMAHLGNATIRWLTQLFPASFESRLNVRILDKKYVSQLLDILKHLCTPEDVADYFYFRALVEYSPFLNISTLIPLSYDRHVSEVPPRVQGCLHMVENMYKHGMRILSTEALGGNLGVWRIPFEYEIATLFEDLKLALLHAARKWFSSETVDSALRKLRTMKLVYLGAKASSPSSYAQDTPEFLNLRDFKLLVKDAVSREFNQTNNSDFVNRASVFSTSVDYNRDTNSLYVPHALVTLPVLMSETLHPIFLAIIGAKMMLGMMAAIDARGSVLSSDNGEYKSWWSSYDRMTFKNKSACFKQQLDTAVKNISSEGNGRDFLNQFIAENAIVEHVYNIYRKNVLRRYPDGLGQKDDMLKKDKVFFYAYAMGHCERPGIEKVQLKYKHALPARLRVNSALANYARFQKAFRCRPGEKMAPSNRCSYWGP
ncbi:hypothetical protein HPB47_025548 [Ixodes persulcatus]|uniref:Uncharacterized protein n=1 Tax=Ixodes persulcatus TaxID=34615 RepID=A0AC60Q169_IXOPE|nr:hypothetical protein HPB47_025548 [Ixodes persulcatus]